MIDQIEIIGYHGTFTENVNNIIEEGYNYIKRDDHWLGQGIYFYDKIDLARWFITRRYGGMHKRQTSVIQSILITTPNKILDLDTNEGVDYLFEKIEELWDELSTITFSAEDEVKNRCILLDIIKAYYEIDIIIKTFETDYQSYGRARIEWFEKHHFPIGIYYNETQICATDNKCIKNSVIMKDFQQYKIPDRIWFKNDRKR